MREQASRAECQLAGAQQQLTEVACQLEEVRAQAAAQAVQGEQDRAQAAQHTAGLESAAASAQLAVSEAEQQLAAERARAAETEAELAAARQQAEEVQANLAAKQRQVSGLQADLAAARQQAAATQVELAAAQQQAASLEADLAAARDVAEARHHQSCERYEAQLQEVVTQLEVRLAAEAVRLRLPRNAAAVQLALKHRLLIPAGLAWQTNGYPCLPPVARLPACLLKPLPCNTHSLAARPTEAWNWRWQRGRVSACARTTSPCSTACRQHSRLWRPTAHLWPALVAWRLAWHRWAPHPTSQLSPLTGQGWCFQP